LRRGPIGAAALSLSLALAGAAAAATFTPADVAGWRRHAFSGETAYALGEIDGEPAVAARCADSASGLFLEAPVDLAATPVIEWRWRVARTFPPGPDEATRAGDDFPARLYVVKDGGLLRWRTRALNYVWASGKPAGADWPNAYASQAHMVAVRSGPAEGWRVERRNLRDDFRRFHGIEPDRIDAIAIMTDCDDRGAEAEAWYGTIRLLPE
jgi:hypothetical protein